MGQSFEERDDRSEGGDVRNRSARAKRGEVDVATVGYDQDILEAVDRADGKATCEVTGGPLVLVDGEGPAPNRRQRINRHRGEGGRVRGGGKYTGG